MNRLLLIGSLAFLLVASTGCAMCGGGRGCNTGGCGDSCGQCGDCGNGPVGVLGKLSAYGGCGLCSSGKCGQGILGRMCGMCGVSNCDNGACGAGGCQAGPLGWQQGGLDYSAHLQAGPLGHDAPNALNSRPFTPGPPSAQVGYPYYSHHGPRDFLMDSPPTLGR